TVDIQNLALDETQDEILYLQERLNGIDINTSLKEIQTQSYE
ncbi:13873_t:CDS:2, partial [Gigaspora margarita]